MGFGYIFLGWFFLLRLQLGGIDITPDFIGCLLIFRGVNRLVECCPDNKAFKFASRFFIPLGLLTLAELGFQIARLSGELDENIEKLAYTPVSVALAILLGGFTVLFLAGIHRLASDVELPKLANRASFLMAVTVVYYLVVMLNSVGVVAFIAEKLPETVVMLSIVNAISMLLGLIWLIGVWLLIYSCYMRICLEGDEDMPYRENSFDKILNAMRKNKK